MEFIGYTKVGRTKSRVAGKILKNLLLYRVYIPFDFARCNIREAFYDWEDFNGLDGN